MHKKILLIRFSSIGDIVLTSPVIRCLKKQFPEASLHVLTKPQNKTLFESNPYVDKVFCLEGKYKPLIDKLKREKYGHIVDLHKNLRSYRIRMALGVKGSSFPKFNLQKYLLVRFGVNILPKIHIVDRYFEAVKCLGVINDGEGLDFFIPETKKLDVGTYFGGALKPYFAVVIGGNHNTKIYPNEKLAETIAGLSMPVLLLGGPEDAIRGDQLQRKFPDKVISLCGELDIHQSASVIEQSAAVLTNDTGLMHIAAALRKPIVSVWGNTVPELGMYPYMPKNEALSILIENSKLRCRPCSKIGYAKCPKGHFKCMMDLDAVQLAEVLERLGN